MSYGAVAQQVASVFNRLRAVDFFEDEDVFPAPNVVNVNQVSPDFFEDEDEFIQPRIITAMLTAGVATDPDQFFAPTAFSQPASINAGVLAGAVGQTSSSINLPSSRVNGNLLVAYVQTVTGGKTFSIGAGWTLVDTTADGKAAWAWRYVDGAEAAAAFSWAGASTYHGRMYQFAGVHASAAIGNSNKNSGSSTALSAAALTTSQDHSLILAILLVANNQTIPLPSNYATIANGGDANGSDRAAFQHVAISGGTSDAVSVTISSAAWQSFLIEIKSP